MDLHSAKIDVGSLYSVPMSPLIVQKGKVSRDRLGMNSIAMEDALSTLCNFDSITYLVELRDECQKIMDEYEDQLLTTFVRHIEYAPLTLLGDPCQNKT